jgi:dienelactone hydrolase
MRLIRRSIAACVAAPLLALPLAAQGTPKKVITQDVYDIWKTLQGQTLSPDGAWLAYTVSPVIGDGELVARSTRGTTEHRVSRGWTGRPNEKAGADSSFNAPPPQFSADSRFVVALTFAPEADFDRARRLPAARRAAAMPRASLAIVSLADGKVTTVPRVRSFQLPKDGGHWLAYLLEPGDTSRARTGADSAGRAALNAATPGGTPRPVGDSTGRARRREYGSTLVLRDLSTGAETRIEDVTAYAFDEDGRWLGYTVASRDVATDGAYARSLADGRTTTLLAGEGRYRSLAFDRKGTQVVFVSDRDEAHAEHPRFTLYHARLGAGQARALVGPAELGDSARVSERGRLEFVHDGGAVVVGIAPPALDSIPADSLADKAVYDLWHWKDARLQPQQRLEVGRDRDRSYSAVYQLAARRLVRLANDSMPNVVVSDDGRHALAVSGAAYAVESMWGEGGSDVWLIDATTGSRTLVARKVSFGAQLSPDSRFIIWYDSSRWHARDIRTGKTADLTGALKDVHFEQETWDTPSTPAPWGVAGWTRNDASVLIYDRYDVWDIDPTGARAPRMVTDSLGRRTNTVFRLVDLEREGRPRRFGGGEADGDDEGLDPTKPVLLHALDERTKASGFWRDRLGLQQAPEKIVMADRAFGPPRKASKADMYVLTESTVRDFPDLYVGERLDALSKVTDANPQQREYRWPTVELVHWVSGDGIPLDGLLYKPEGFDASRKYPMLVYFYEQMSDGLHTYYAPAGRNIINPTVYTSKGYLVFIPDIAYKNGYPGPSAVKSVIPGVQSLISRGFVDPKALGISGQSWGGYQTAFIVTQSDMFAAAVPNATVSNMTSAYGGIRWETGVARAFQYEHTQSRIGGSLWEYPLRYIENSPLFWADKITTPLLFMANDADGAVPWYQGIEFFVALRRLGKEAYMVDYNGDSHNPRKRANQLDIDQKMQEFFDTKLRGAPAPEWMVRGIPYLQKGRDQIQPRKVAGTKDR